MSVSIFYRNISKVGFLKSPFEMIILSKNPTGFNFITCNALIKVSFLFRNYITIIFNNYCFFNLINPLMSIVLAYLGIGMGNDEPVASDAVANSQENNSVLEGVSR